MKFFIKNAKNTWGSGCGSVCRVVASDTRDLLLESQHRQNFIYPFYNIKVENKEKEAKKYPSFEDF